MLVVLLGVYAFVSGIFTVLVGAVWPPGWGLRWPMVLQGVLGIVVGVLVFIRPETAALVLLYLIAAWAIVSGRPPDSRGRQIAQGDPGRMGP